MTSPPETDLVRRVAALERAIAAGDGLFDRTDLDRAGIITARAHDRLRHGTDLTVVALAGATGSGKSSLFNTIVGAEIAPTGVTRPTTSQARAAVFGEEVPGDLLDWLGVRHRHGVTAGDLDRLVLLDLPDHDSVQTDHRLEVDRLVELVDLMVWVLDPQKYADEALHEGYLAPLSDHADSMIFALNHADSIDEADRTQWRSHATDLLRDDGIAAPIVVETSATTGEGIPALREILEGRIATRDAALVRLAADMAHGAVSLGAVPRPELDRRDRHADALETSIAAAAGGELVAEAVADGYRFDAIRATGWPFSRWLLRFRRHPLLRLRPPPQQHSAAVAPPTAVPVDRPRLELALRTYADGRAGDVPPRWTRRAREAASAREDELVAAVGTRITGIAAHSIRRPRWWSAFSWVQRLLATAAVVGAVWLAVLAVLGYLKVPTEELTPHLGAWPVPTLLLLCGAGAGLVLAWLTKIPIGIGARRRAGRARSALKAGLAAVAAEFVIAPVDGELERWGRIAADLDLAAGH